MSAQHLLMSRAVPHLCGMPKRVRDKRWILALRAFFDETGLDPKTHTALVFDGFLGQVEQWELASDAWDKCLKASPSIGYFSGHQAQVLEGEFGHFSRAESDRKVTDLATTISSFSLMGFCIYIRHKSFANRDTRSMKGVVGSRLYDWVFLASIEGVLEHVEGLRDKEKVDFVFDERRELDACIPAFYRAKVACRKTFYRYAGQCDPGNDKDVVALQMADLLAGEFYRRKESGQMSEALRLIIETNGLMEIACAPHPLVNSILSLDRMGAQIRSEAISVLSDIKAAKAKYLTAELARRLKNLQQRQAYYETQLERHKEMRMSEEFQEFNTAMDQILKADPKTIKDQMETVKKERAAKRKATS